MFIGPFSRIKGQPLENKKQTVQRQSPTGCQNKSIRKTGSSKAGEKNPCRETEPQKTGNTRRRSNKKGRRSD